MTSRYPRAVARDEPDSLPFSFSIVGAQKAGTTSLAFAMFKHPLICRPPKKEMHFFDNESYDWEQPDYSDYRCPRRRRKQRVAGDATPAYLFWPNALKRMHDYNPDMLLIASFRDPIERAFSHWSQYRAKIPKFPDFVRLLNTARPTSLEPLDLDAQHPYRRRSVIARGYYGEQLRRGLEVFDREQWLMLDFDRTHAEHEATLDRVTDFLRVPRFDPHPPSVHRLRSPSALTGRPPSAAHIAGLASLYERDLAEFAELSGLDVSAWSTSRILAGTLEPGELADRLARKAGLVH